MAEDDGDHTRLSSTLCELKSRAGTQKRGVEPHSVPSVKLRSTREAPSLEAD